MRRTSNTVVYEAVDLEEVAIEMTNASSGGELKQLLKGIASIYTPNSTMNFHIKQPSSNAILDTANAAILGAAYVLLAFSDDDYATNIISAALAKKIYDTFKGNTEKFITSLNYVVFQAIKLGLSPYLKTLCSSIKKIHSPLVATSANQKTNKLKSAALKFIRSTQRYLPNNEQHPNYTGYDPLTLTLDRIISDDASTQFMIENVDDNSNGWSAVKIRRGYSNKPKLTSQPNNKHQYPSYYDDDGDAGSDSEDDDNTPGAVDCDNPYSNLHPDDDGDAGSSSENERIDESGSEEKDTEHNKLLREMNELEKAREKIINERSDDNVATIANKLKSSYDALNEEIGSHNLNNEEMASLFLIIRGFWNIYDKDYEWNWKEDAKAVIVNDENSKKIREDIVAKIKQKITDLLEIKNEKAIILFANLLTTFMCHIEACDTQLEILLPAIGDNFDINKCNNDGNTSKKVVDGVSMLGIKYRFKPMPIVKATVTTKQVGIQSVVPTGDDDTEKYKSPEISNYINYSNEELKKLIETTGNKNTKIALFLRGEFVTEDQTKLEKIFKGIHLKIRDFILFCTSERETLATTLDSERSNDFFNLIKRFIGENSGQGQKESFNKTINDIFNTTEGWTLKHDASEKEKTDSEKNNETPPTAEQIISYMLDSKNKYGDKNHVVNFIKEMYKIDGLIGFLNNHETNNHPVSSFITYIMELAYTINNTKYQIDIIAPKSKTLYDVMEHEDGNEGIKVAEVHSIGVKIMGGATIFKANVTTAEEPPTNKPSVPNDPSTFFQPSDPEKEIREAMNALSDALNDNDATLARDTILREINNFWGNYDPNYDYEKRNKDATAALNPSETNDGKATKQKMEDGFSAQIKNHVKNEAKRDVLTKAAVKFICMLEKNNCEIINTDTGSEYNSTTMEDTGKLVEVVTRCNMFGVKDTNNPIAIRKAEVTTKFSCKDTAVTHNPSITTQPSKAPMRGYGTPESSRISSEIGGCMLDIKNIIYEKYENKDNEAEAVLFGIINDFLENNKNGLKSSEPDSDSESQNVTLFTDYINEMRDVELFFESNSCIESFAKNVIKLLSIIAKPEPLSLELLIPKPGTQYIPTMYDNIDTNVTVTEQIMLGVADRSGKTIIPCSVKTDIDETAKNRGARDTPVSSQQACMTR